MIFGRTPFIPGSSEKVALQVLDLSSKQVSIFPGSENLYSPRLSPDGKHLAALSSDNSQGGVRKAAVSARKLPWWRFC